MVYDRNLLDKYGQPALIRFDWAMKRLLRDKASYVVLEGFLTCLLGRQIKIVSILESEGNQESGDDKFNRVDILAEDDLGEKLLIEVQNESQYSYFHRMLYGVSKLITEYIKKGEPYENVAKVISINIVYFSLGQGSDYVYVGTTNFYGLHNHDRLQIPENWKNKLEIKEVQDIFPEYYILRVNEFDEVSKTPLDQWISFLKTGMIPAEADAPGLPEAREKMRVDALSPNERNAYYEHLQSDVDTRDILETAHLEGREEGLQEGREAGLQEGRQAGLQEGREEERRATILNMAKAGCDAATIAKLTSYPLDEIEHILSD